MTDTVDILLATFQGQRFLAEQLCSIESQTHRNWRMIIRDDGSADGTSAIIDDFAQRHDDKVRVLQDGRAQIGACGNFAALMEASDAPYFMFCDQDDVWLPQKITTLLASMREMEARRGTQTPLLVHSDVILVDDRLHVIAQSYWRYARLIAPSARRPAERLMLRNYVTGCAAIGNAALRRAALPIPPEARMHDWWIALVAALRGEIAEHAAPTVLYRQHQSNELGAQSRLPLALLRQFLHAPEAVAKRVRDDIVKAQQQAAACYQVHSQAIPPQLSQTLGEFARLSGAGFWRRKLFLPRSGLWPDYWLSSAICWWFL